MRIIAWNVAHQTRERAIPASFMSCVEGLCPDVIVLNEYIHGTSRAGLVHALREAGLPHCEVSERHNQHNQVLIAARYEMKRGDLLGPGNTPIAWSNFLHVSFPQQGFELAGMRVPAFRKARDVASYWKDFRDLASSVIDRRIIFAGDLNANPERTRHTGGRAMRDLLNTGWLHQQPSGEWGFWRNGKISRVDHALTSPAFGAVKTSYVKDVGGIALAGQKGSISDHAAMLIESP
jgi:hypothetical protein